MEKWHTHLGVYGVYFREKKLLVVEKTRGPYQNRYDLPGGSFENNESIFECLTREMVEEVGEGFYYGSCIGTHDYLVPYQHDNCTHVHHIAIFYEAKHRNTLKAQAIQADDTKGYALVDIEKLNIDNASPLVMDAVSYLKGRLPKSTMRRYDQWEIRQL